MAEYLDIDLAYAAGIIDGEGFVFKQRQGIPEEEISARREYVTEAQSLNRGGQ